jgi:hypothetical protein
VRVRAIVSRSFTRGVDAAVVDALGCFYTLPYGRVRRE